MSEDHCVDRNDGRCDPNDDGGPLLGNAWSRFHDQNNRNVTIRFQRSHGQRRIPISTWGQLGAALLLLMPATVGEDIFQHSQHVFLGVPFARLWRSNESN
jgi:hypothetical protein